MTIATAIALALQLLAGIQKAVAAGQNDVSEADIDAALAGLGSSDQALSDAIERARNRDE